MDKIAHTSQKVGLASAMAVVLLLIIFACNDFTEAYSSNWYLTNAAMRMN
ncbi:MAG: hypothetical protein ACLVCH_12810 [Roseburia inulinivorans]